MEVASPRDTTNEVTANQESQIEEDLPPEVLDLLGVDKARQPQLTEAIHVSVARRWEKLLKSGMESDSIAELVKKYPPMTNCRLVAAPQLNKQVCAVLSEQHKNRDIRLAELQNQLGASMSAIGRALSCLLNEGEDRNLPLIELLSDAGKLLANVHFEDSQSRRNLVLTGVNRQFRDTLNSVPVDGWLFGEDLEDRMKEAKALEKSSLDLKLKPKPTKKPVSKQRHLNAQGQLRYRRGTNQSRPKHVSQRNQGSGYKSSTKHPATGHSCRRSDQQVNRLQPRQVDQRLYRYPERN